MGSCLPPASDVKASWMFASYHSDLIYDIGMHVGDDTDFYLVRASVLLRSRRIPSLQRKRRRGSPEQSPRPD